MIVCKKVWLIYPGGNLGLLLSHLTRSFGYNTRRASTPGGVLGKMITLWCYLWIFNPVMTLFSPPSLQEALAFVIQKQALHHAFNLFRSPSSSNIIISSLTLSIFTCPNVSSEEYPHHNHPIPSSTSYVSKYYEQLF